MKLGKVNSHRQTNLEPRICSKYDVTRPQYPKVTKQSPSFARQHKCRKNKIFIALFSLSLNKQKTAYVLLYLTILNGIVKANEFNEIFPTYFSYRLAKKNRRDFFRIYMYADRWYTYLSTLLTWVKQMHVLRGWKRKERGTFSIFLGYTNFITVIFSSVIVRPESTKLSNVNHLIGEEWENLWDDIYNNNMGSCAAQRPAAS